MDTTRNGIGRRILIVVLAIASLVMVSQIAEAATTWTGSTGTTRVATENTLGRPRTCGIGTGASCTSGGVFFDGPPSFAVGNSGATNYWYAAWTSDRSPGNETWNGSSQNLVPYGAGCNTQPNPSNNVALTSNTEPGANSGTINIGATSTTISRDISSVIGTGTGNAVVTLRSTGGNPGPFPGATASDPGIAKWDTVALAGVLEGGLPSGNFADGDYIVQGVDSTRVFQINIGGTAASDLDTGTASIYRATFTTSAAHGYEPYSAAVVGGYTGAHANWDLENNAAVYSAHYVQTVPSLTTFTTNLVGVPATNPSTVTGTWARHTTTFTASAAHGLSAGSVANVTGVAPAKFNGAWTVRVSPAPTATAFTVDVDTNPAGSGGLGGAVAKPPYCSGVYFNRSSTQGTSWGVPISLDTGTTIGGNTHVDRYAIAAEGTDVHMIYATTVGYYASMAADTPRVLYYRKSTNNGGTWGSAIQISPSADRVNYPTVAASGSTVVIVDQETLSGEDASACRGTGSGPTCDTTVNVYVSLDNGATFTKFVGGKTSSTYDAATAASSFQIASVEGWDGQASVAVGGTGDKTIAVAFNKDNRGKVMGRIGTINGAGPATGITWGGGCPGATCTQTLTPAGGKGSIGTHAANSCPSWNAGNPYSSGACGASMTSVVMSGTGAATRATFAWVNDDCATYTFTGCVSNRLPGLYAKTWKATGGWQPSRLVSCFQSIGTCAGAAATAAWMGGYTPSVAHYGTDGIGIAWAACDLGPTVACNGAAADHGDGVLYKESGDGVKFGANWGSAGSFQTVATNVDGGTSSDSAINQYPTLVFDKAADSTTGCAVGTGGKPEIGCQAIVYYLGRNSAYTIYRAYMAIGTES